MKLTIPEMTPESDNGFPIFKPYGQHWYHVNISNKQRKGTTTHVRTETVTPVGNCAGCIHVAPTGTVCGACNDGTLVAPVAPFVVTLVDNRNIPDESTSPRIYVLHPVITAELYKYESGPGVETWSEHAFTMMDPREIPCAAQEHFIINHRKIFPYACGEDIIMDNPSPEDIQLVEHQERMAKIRDAIKRNEFEQEDLDHLKACFPWIGNKTSTEFKEFQ